MTDNEKLARWQGKCWHKSIFYIDDYHDQVDCKCEYCGYGDTKNPDYFNDDAASMSLLDTLVDKEYGVRMFYDDITPDIENKWVVEVLIDKSYWGIAATRREAVVAACLELIDKGA